MTRCDRALLVMALTCTPLVSWPQARGAHSAHADTVGLRQTLDSIRQAIGAHGASAAVIWPDGRLEIVISGEAWAGAPMTPATLFDIGSITKSYTAALVLRLIDEGALTLEEPVAKWFPDLPGADGVTMRDLLRQTSGIADYASSPEFLPAIRAGMAGPWPPEGNLRFVEARAFEPGDKWQYSNTNYLLLGLVATRAGGHPLSRLFRAELLDSLGLSNTFVSGEDDITGHRAHAFLDFTGDGKADDLSAFVPDPATTRGAGGAGAIVATAADLARFARAYYSGTIMPNELRDDAMDWVDRGDGWQYGFGIIAAPFGSDTLLGHLGNTAGQSAGVWHSRQANVTVAILTNVHGVRMAEPVRALLTRALGAPRR